MTNYYLADYAYMQPFESRQELDQATAEFNHLLSPKEYELFNYLRQCAGHDIYGICQTKQRTISEKLGVSVATVKRRLNALLEKGVLTIEHFIRPKKKGYGASIYIFARNDKQRRKFAKLHRKNKNELPEMSYRKRDIDSRQNQQAQAFAHVRNKKRSIIFYSKTHKSLCTTSVSRKDERIRNIKAAKVRPQGLPERFYKLYAPYFTDKQLLRMYRILDDKATFYATHPDGLDDFMKDEIIELSMNALVKALKRQYRYKGFTVRNIFAYVSKAADNIGFNADYYNDIHRYTPLDGGVEYP